jgi:hypothetical protein
MKRVLAVTSAAFLALGGVALAQTQPGMGSSPSGTSAGQSKSGMSSSMSGSQSDNSSATHGSQHVSSDQVKEAQNELKQQGLYNGTVDGIVGPQTKSAISQFQKKSGLRQTAQLDQQTLSRLSSGGTSGSPASGGSGSSMGGGSNSMPDQNSSSAGAPSGGMSSPAAPPAH